MRVISKILIFIYTYFKDYANINNQTNISNKQNPLPNLLEAVKLTASMHAGDNRFHPYTIMRNYLMSGNANYFSGDSTTGVKCRSLMTGYNCNFIRQKLIDLAISNGRLQKKQFYNSSDFEIALNHFWNLHKSTLLSGWENK